MRALIVCESRAYGNTRKLAERFAAELAADVVAPHELRPDQLEPYDLVGFGSGIYAMNFYRELRQFISELPAAEGRRAFVFLTSASSERSMKKPVKNLSMVLTNGGWDVAGHFWCRGFWNPTILRVFGGVNKGHPDVADLAAATAFATKLELRSETASVVVDSTTRR